MNPSQANPLKGHDKIPSNVESNTKRGIEVELKVPIKQDEGIFDRANEESSMKILLLPLQWIILAMKCLTIQWNSNPPPNEILTHPTFSPKTCWNWVQQRIHRQKLGEMDLLKPTTKRL